MPQDPVQALIVAVLETAGSALYGMVDVLAATGSLWQQLVGIEPMGSPIRPRIVAGSRSAFRCGNGIPVRPDVGVDDDPEADIVILPELWLAPDDDMKGRYPELLEWIRRRYRAGSVVYSACSGSVMLAATGLLSGREATSHWGYQDLFRTRYPDVHFRPEPNLAFADPAGRIVTAGGTTSWHDLAIHIISRHCSPGEALRIAKGAAALCEPGAPPAACRFGGPAVRGVARAALSRCPCDRGVVAASGRPDRSLKRRFKMATGSTLIGYVQNLRIEEAKRMLESEDHSFEAIAAAIGYENQAFFRRLFRRSTGLTPGQYRRMFRPIATAALPEPPQPAAA